jgi:hypothetical protein
MLLPFSRHRDFPFGHETLNAAHVFREEADLQEGGGEECARSKPGRLPSLTEREMKNMIAPTALRLLGAMSLTLCMSLPIAAQGEQASGPASNPDESNKQLLERIKELEAKMKQLEEKLAATTAAPAATTPPPAPVAAPPPVAAPVSVEMPAVNEVAPRLKMDIFGDVGANVFNHVPGTFEFGSLDLFMRARLSDKVSALGEVLFVAQSDNSIGVDVERLLLQYRQNDYFTVAAGRYHTWVGYYNTAFNKGEFLETTVDRPFVYAFDDPGKIPSGKLGLNWVLEAGNGRAWGSDVEPTQNNQDANNSKAINGGLFIQPAKFSGLQAGFSVRHDNITYPGPSIGEMIATAHVVFTDSKYEILNEAVLVRHVESTGPVFQTSAFYTQFSRAFGRVRPYFRYQYFNAPSNDPVYAFAGQNTYVPLNVTTFVGRLNGPSLGVRWDFTEHSALKLQYDRYSFRGLDTENGVTGQLAFTF